MSAREIFLPPVCDALCSCWICSSLLMTLASSAGWLASQSFCGVSRTRAPLAPPRLSVPRKVDADAQAAEANCEVVRPEDSTFRLSSATSDAPTRGWSTEGTGSCHSCGSGTPGPRQREYGPMSRWVSLYQALAKAASNSAGFS